MRWTDGSCYVGTWMRGIQHGYGKIIAPDGTFKEGYFENNIYVGTIPMEEQRKIAAQRAKEKAERERLRQEKLREER